MVLSYQFEGKLYLNITNICPCACVFCIRDNGDSVGDGDNLWLPHEPTSGEMIADLKTRDLDSYPEIVFCGYGEPCENLDVLLDTAKYIRSASKTPIRLNTNGLSELSIKKQVPEMLAGLIDTASISLNAPNPKRFLDVTQSTLGDDSFNAMLRFARDAKKYIPTVVFSVVDVISADEIAQCQLIADEMGIPLRVRAKI